MTPLYDPMVAKLIVWDVDRETATARMLRALGEYRIEPLTTLIPFHKRDPRHRAVGEGRDLPRPHRGQEVAEDACAPPRRRRARPGREDEGEETAERNYKVEVDGRLHAVKVIGAAAPAAGAARRPGAPRPPKRERRAGAGGGGGGPRLTSPLQGTVLKVAVEKGAEVEEGALICVIEAMKMENEITAHRAGKVTELNVSEGAAINAGDPIARSSRR